MNASSYPSLTFFGGVEWKRSFETNKGMATLGPVLICKAHSDAYATALTESGFIPYFIPVLDTTLVNQEIVISTLLGGSRNNYSGVIITSSRAAEAWQIAVNELVANGNGNTGMNDDE